jgi:hypothetical protein
MPNNADQQHPTRIRHQMTAATNNPPAWINQQLAAFAKPDVPDWLTN